jgi:hypothetical protein
MGFVHYELIDRKQDPDSFFLNPDGTKDFERKLDFTNSYGILNPFFLVKEGVRHYYQYIAGCAIYDPAEQKKTRDFANVAKQFGSVCKGC